MTLTLLLQRYEQLVAKADQAFEKMAKDYPRCVKCKSHCSDCCHALFGLFLIEAVYLKHHFDKLGRKARRAAIQRSKKADRGLKNLGNRLKAQYGDHQIPKYSLARERIRCPLLDDNEECILYPYRPITCRVYGIPTSIQGKAHVCGKAGFKKGEFYPAFNLDNVQRKLYQLSKELLGGDEEKASILIAVSKSIETPLEDIIHGSFKQPDIAD